MLYLIGKTVDCRVDEGRGPGENVGHKVELAVLGWGHRVHHCVPKLSSLARNKDFCMQNGISV